MKYVKLGTTGLDVSRIALGCMSFGVPERGDHPWTLSEEESWPYIRRAVEFGINFFDTSNSYSDGTSEEIVGRALAEYADRDNIVVATKVRFRTRPGPNGQGLSRKSIIAEIDNSLRRLGMDYVDLYQIHRTDRRVPIEETLEALHDVVKAGKARYIGASSMPAWEFAKAIYTSKINGWTPFATMQNHYNLLYREEEREMLPLCADLGIGVVPWSPLARGRLTRDWSESTRRQQEDQVLKGLYTSSEDSDRAIIAAVARIAAEREVTRAQVALAWVASRPGVAAPIIGTTKPHHLDDAVAGLELKLTPDEISELEAPYTPRPVQGH